MAKRKRIETDIEEIMPLLIGIWRKMFKLSGPPDELQTREFRSFVANVKSLYEAESKEQEGSLSQALQSRDLLGAYFLYFWPLRYLEAMHLLGELPKTGYSALDLSVGPSPFAFAALKHGYLDVTSIGSNEGALNLTAEAAGRYGYPLQIRNELARFKTGSKRYDLITLSYTLLDLYPSDSLAHSEKRKELVLDLLNSLTPEGYLLIVDGSTEKKNKKILELRDQIVEGGYSIQAPCIYQGRCPALANKNICFAQRELQKPYLIQEAQRSGRINMNSLKMSYLIVRSKEASLPDIQKDLYRIISPPFEERGKKTYYLCGKGGRKKLTSSLETATKETRAFEFIKRGEAIEIQGAQVEGNTFVLNEMSKLRVAAPLSKPLLAQEGEEHS
ncbi:small ribosomal subunit Rsm22 family protein [Estrella lausannensis]|uniref:Methyltransferase n=1 Tax=Estrella lausannensis TaxID=483423 RepID=A0A0H5DT26_9BACT|nr:small ribosomal subunit Rsm22 family protein [Estrella lausannensis]CRX38959.1 Conserved hypothetical protein [Estrella lausannensis]